MIIWNLEEVSLSTVQLLIYQAKEKYRGVFEINIYLSIQKPTWGVSRGPKGRVGKGTGGVSPPVGGGSGASPEKILKKKWSKTVQSGVQIKPFKLTQTKLYLL